VGIAKMIELLQEEFPKLQFGYFNRTRDRFHSSSKSPVSASS
jgi:hypothetical protein